MVNDDISQNTPTEPGIYLARLHSWDRNYKYIVVILGTPPFLKILQWDLCNYMGKCPAGVVSVLEPYQLKSLYFSDDQLNIYNEAEDTISDFTFEVPEHLITEMPR